METTIDKKKKVIIVFAVAFLLLIPLIVIQFTDEVRWTLLDFIVAAFLLFIGGLIGDLILRKFKNPRFRIGLFIVLFVILLLVYAEIGVGVFGTWFSGQ